MSQERPTGLDAGHREISALIPWYVNGSIGDADRLRLDEHLPTCAACRDDLRLERRVHASMSGDAPLEYMPAASLKRLQASLDAAAAGPSHMHGSRPPPPARASPPWRGWMAASMAALAVALGVLAAEEWTQIHARQSAADYYTVTTPGPHAPGAVIRAVFSPAITLAELQAILGEAQLKIVAGPTEAGVYSLAASSSRPAGISLTLLRQHAAVRFAEITQPNATASASP